METMEFLCIRCATRIPVTPAGSDPVVRCPKCGGRYRVSVPHDPNQRYRHAREFATYHQISEANAYSVLEGLMTLHDARLLEKGVRPTLGPTPAPTAPVKDGTDGAKFDYDHSFDAAVQHGYLSPRQASERGDRGALARRLSDRHRLPLNLALMVADNRMSIRQAMAAKGDKEVSSLPARAGSGGWRRVATVTVGMAIAAWVFLRPQADPAPPGTQGLSARIASAAVPSTDVSLKDTAPLERIDQVSRRVDATGQLVEIAGPDPASVLIAYCDAGEAVTRRAIEILPAVPPNPGLRYGLLTTLTREGLARRVIQIRKDPNAGRWVAGNGRGPIVTMAPPAQPPGTQGKKIASD